MRYIKTTNNQIEFIEANDNGQILNSIGLQLGEVYFQIKNRKVAFYLNDSEKPFDNFIWSMNLPITIDEETYDDEEEASAALSAIMNDSFQEKLDELKEDLDDEIADRISGDTYLEGLINAEISRSTAKDNEHDALISGLTSDLADEITRSSEKDAEHDAEISGLTDSLDNEIERAMSAETILHNEILAEENRALAAESALTNALNDEITRSTAKDASQDSLISGLNTSLQNEINRAVGAENSLRNDLNAEISARTSADAAQLQRITALEVGKADANNVYTKAESDAKYATKDYVSGLTDNFYTKGQTNELLAAKADKANAVSTALYNSANKTIDFKNINGNVIASVDARDFIKDGMVDTVSISGSNLVITFNTDAGKEPISIPLTGIFDPSNYYDKTSIDGIVSGLNDSIDSKLDASAYTPTDLSNYYTKSEVDASQLAQDNKIDAISGDILTISGDVISISGNVLSSGDVQTMIDNSLSGKQDTLTAGRGIDITSNVVSFDLPISAGTNSGDVITSIVQGTNCTASGDSSHAEGHNSKAYGYGSHAEGENTKAYGRHSHSEGIGSRASGDSSHAEGYYTLAIGRYSHTEGKQTTAYTEASHTEGSATTTSNDFEMAIGVVNATTSASTTFGDSGNTLFSVGNGITTNGHNALDVRQDGSIYVADVNDTSTSNFYEKPMFKLQDALDELNNEVATISGDAISSGDVQTMITQSVSGKQDTLVSGTNIKTINNESLLGSGNIDIQGGGVDVVQTTGTSTTDVMSQNAVTTQLNGKADAISLDMVGSPKKKVTFQLKSGGNNGTIVNSKDLTLGRGLVYGEEGVTTLSTSGLVETSAITTSISSASTDAQVPSAKAVYNAIQGGGGGGVTPTEVQTMIDNSISGLTNETDFSAHTADTSIHFTTGDVQSMITAATSGLQQALTAGTNVQINNNVISATDTKYTAGDGISISNQNVISTVTKFACVSESEWSSISGNPQSNTVYLIY